MTKEEIIEAINDLPDDDKYAEMKIRMNELEHQFRMLEKIYSNNTEILFQVLRTLNILDPDYVKNKLKVYM